MGFGGSHKESRAQRCIDIPQGKDKVMTEISYQSLLAKPFSFCVYLFTKANVYVLSM